MRVLLFGIVAEKAGTDVVESFADTAGALRAELEQRIPGLDRMSYALAIDRRISKQDQALNGHEEVAVLPPFAGG